MNKFPSSFMLQNVQCLEPLSRTRGIFGQVYRGAMGSKGVAIKRLELHFKPWGFIEDQKVKREIVCTPIVCLKSFAMFMYCLTGLLS